jgi:hypothetical protein
MHAWIIAIEISVAAALFVLGFICGRTTKCGTPPRDEHGRFTTRRPFYILHNKDMRQNKEKENG